MLKIAPWKKMGTVLDCPGDEVLVAGGPGRCNLTTVATAAAAVTDAPAVGCRVLMLAGVMKTVAELGLLVEGLVQGGLVDRGRLVVLG